MIDRKAALVFLSNSPLFGSLPASEQDEIKAEMSRAPAQPTTIGDDQGAALFIEMNALQLTSDPSEGDRRVAAARWLYLSEIQKARIRRLVKLERLLAMEECLEEARGVEAEYRASLVPGRWTAAVDVLEGVTNVIQQIKARMLREAKN